MNPTSGQVLSVALELTNYTLKPADKSKCEQPLRNGFDAVALYLHSLMLFAGFRLVGLGESATLNEWPTFKYEDMELSALPSNWAESSDVYAFRYKHTQSSMTYLLKMLKLAKNLQVSAIAVEDGKVFEQRYMISELTREDSFPLAVPCDKYQLEEAVHSYEFLFHDFKTNIVQQLIPGLLKPGFERQTSSQSTQTATGSRPVPTNPLQRPPAAPRDRPIGIVPQMPRFPHPFGIGDRDLDPLGSMRPPHAGGGMYVGPDHPMFFQDPSAYRPPFAGPGALPPGSVPPGARFDPIFPNVGPRPPMPRPPRTGEPDNDEFQPPGYNDMFM